MADTIKIMIVEDELLTVELLHHYLADRGYEVAASVSSGADALRELGNKFPDLILMDIHIKGDIDGIELTGMINERYDIPVIYLTAFADGKLIARAKETESYAYIIKPFGELELMSNIEMALYKHKMDMKLKRSEERYRTLVETMQDAIYMRDTKGRLIQFNKALEGLLGYTREELEEMDIGTTYADEHRKIEFQSLLRRDGYVKDFETRLLRKDGVIIDCLITATMEKHDKRKGALIRGIIREITDKKQMEQEQAQTLRWQQGVSHLMQSLLSPAPLEAKLQSITDGIIAIFEADFCRIWLTRPGDLCERECVHADAGEGQHICKYRDMCLHLLASSGRYTHTDGAVHRRIPFGYYKIGSIASGEEHLFLTNDVQNDPLILDPEWARGLGLVSFAGYQLHVPGGETLGVLALFSKHPILPMEDALLDSISSAVGSVIQKAVAEDALNRSMSEIQDLYNNAPCGYHSLDEEGVIIRINETELRWLGYNRDEVVGKMKYTDLMTPASRLLFAEKFPLFKEQGWIKDIEFEVTCKNGSVMTILLNSTAVKDAAGNFIMSRTSIFDISDRKYAEAAAVESDKRYRTLFAEMKDALYIHTMDGQLIDFNPALLELYGYTQEEFLQMNVRDIFVDQNDRGRFMSVMKKNGYIKNFETRHYKKDGSILECLITSSPIYSADGTIAAIRGIIHDITERNRYLEELKSAHSEINNLLDSIASILIGVSTKDVITHWNRVAEETFGLRSSEAVGNLIMGFNINWDWPEIYMGISTSIAEDRSVSLGDVKYVDKNGKNGLLGITVTPIKNETGEYKGFILYGKDITDRRLAEQQLLQSSKLATIGEMATGVAHELNQPLNIIKMASQYMLDGVTEHYYTEDFLKERIEKIIKQVGRASHIIGNLKDFGRKSDFNMQPLDPNQPVRVAFDMMGEQLHHHAIVTNLELERLPLIRGDLQKLEQVFINLIVNARDAFEEANAAGREKIITVRSSYSADNDSIRIEFGDNGPGMPEEVAGRVFEPFFTTKEVGKGTGLGLSISYGIIKSHGGSIEVRPGDPGVTFIIQIPAAMH